MKNLEGVRFAKERSTLLIVGNVQIS